MATNDDEGDVVLGKITAVHGLQGWVNVFSYSRPREQIFDYLQWDLLQTQRSTISVVDGRVQGKTLVAQLAGIDSRSDAEALIGAEIVVPSTRLAELPINEYYWRQLIGLTVVDKQGQPFGVITDMLETGANDVMLITGLVDDVPVDDMPANDGPGDAKAAKKQPKALASPRSWAIPWLDEVVLGVDLEAKVVKVDWDEDF